MEPTGPEQNPPGQESPKTGGVYVSMREPVFSYVANKLAPVYQQQLEEVRRDGSYNGIKKFHESPFGSIMGQILDVATAQEVAHLPKVGLNVTDAQMHELKNRIEPPFDAAGRHLHTQLMGELTDSYRMAKFDKRIKDAKRKVKSFFGK